MAHKLARVSRFYANHQTLVIHLVSRISYETIIINEMY